MAPDSYSLPLSPFVKVDRLMKLSCDRQKLLHAFQMAAGVVPARSPKPILQNVKLEVTGETATLMATAGATATGQGRGTPTASSGRPKRSTSATSPDPGTRATGTA